MEVIAKETSEADIVKDAVSIEEAVASAEAAKVKAIKTECEHDLAEAIPVLEKAVKALNTLTKGDIGEVKVWTAIILVMAAFSQSVASL